MSLGAVYEQDSLLGTYGTGHFQIQDGYSSGARTRLDSTGFSSTWNTRMHVAYYTGTAQAVHPGAVSELSLRQSSVSLSLERHAVLQQHGNQQSYRLASAAIAGPEVLSTRLAPL